jgi:hypothetical protein
MIIHCLSCGKAISSEKPSCPYCLAEVSDITLEINGLKTNTKIKESVLDLVLGFVHK